MNYGALTLSSHELPTMTLDPIELPSDDTFPLLLVKWTVNGDIIFFSIFAPTLEGISVILVI
jgi:hypothetical protein